jgi:hypothetical protein
LAVARPEVKLVFGSYSDTALIHERKLHLHMIGNPSIMPGSDWRLTQNYETHYSNVYKEIDLLMKEGERLFPNFNRVAFPLSAFPLD